MYINVLLFDTNKTNLFMIIHRKYMGRIIRDFVVLGVSTYHFTNHKWDQLIALIFRIMRELEGLTHTFLF